MTEEISYIPEPPQTFEGTPEKKKSMTLWIILAVAAVVLICCCLVVILPLVFGISLFDFDSYMNLIPYLSWM